MSDSITRPPYDAVLGRIPSGVYILTLGTGDRATGMLASWVMQAGFEPPMVSIAIKKERYVAEWLTAGQPFVINIVGEGQHQHFKQFGKGFEPDEPAFEGIDIELCPRGVPILKESVGHLQCEPVSHLDSGDHRIFLAKVVRGTMSSQEIKPMVHIRKTGSQY